MTKRLRVVVEVGPKEKRFVAVAPDWPGLERGARTREGAIEKLESYTRRYEKVARLARMGPEFASHKRVEVVEEYPGTGSTDFWGISFAFSDIDRKKVSDAELRREMALMRACWRYFDQVRERVSSEMQKGPRGGGRDRDRIVRHVFAAEQDWAKTKLGVHIADGDVVVTDDAGVKSYRDAYCRAIREYHREGRLGRSWPLRYLVRHSAYHTMDHAWEMEDKDLTAR